MDRGKKAALLYVHDIQHWDKERENVSWSETEITCWDVDKRKRIFMELCGSPALLHNFFWKWKVFLWWNINAEFAPGAVIIRPACPWGLKGKHCITDGSYLQGRIWWIFKATAIWSHMKIKTSLYWAGQISYPGNRTNRFHVWTIVFLAILYLKATFITMVAL